MYIMNKSLERKSGSSFQPLYQGMFHVPNAARNGERPRDGTN